MTDLDQHGDLVGRQPPRKDNHGKHDTLCVYCQDIEEKLVVAARDTAADPDTSLDGPGHTVARFPVSNLQPGNGCSLCDLFIRSMGAAPADPSSAHDMLTLTAVRDRMRSQSTMILRLLGPRTEDIRDTTKKPLFLHVDSVKYRVRPAVKMWLDYPWIRKKLRRLRSVEASRLKWREFPDLRLIDCEQMKIVAKSSRDVSRYLALSYVWSEPQRTKPPVVQLGSLLDRKLLPRSIDDAITFTLAIGERYLWVDRFCIEQHDGGIKQRQIQSMTAIFRHAWLTLVAPGPDDTAPLAGVSVPKPMLLHSSLRPGMLFNVDNVAEEIAKSVWASRAWTFQEALLSNRLLFFLRAGVVLSTPASIWPEPCAELDEVQYSMFKALIEDRADPRSEKDCMLQPFQWTKEPELLHAAFREYSSRDLTYEVDALNAFWGYLDSVLDYLHHGVPGLCLEPASSKEHQILGFCLGLLWIQTPWTGGTATCMCGIFPSWSWASCRRLASLSYDFGWPVPALDHRLAQWPVQELSHVLEQEQRGIAFSAMADTHISCCDIGRPGYKPGYSVFSHASSTDASRAPPSQESTNTIIFVGYACQVQISQHDGIAEGVFRDPNSELGFDRDGSVVCDIDYRTGTCQLHHLRSGMGEFIAKALLLYIYASNGRFRGHWLLVEPAKVEGKWVRAGTTSTRGKSLRPFSSLTKEELKII
jgi:hypothetical protein